MTELINSTMFLTIVDNGDCSTVSSTLFRTIELNVLCVCVSMVIFFEKIKKEFRTALLQVQVVHGAFSVVHARVVLNEARPALLCTVSKFPLSRLAVCPWPSFCLSFVFW